MTNNRSTTDNISERARDLIEQGNSRRVILKTSDGRQFAEFSLTVAAIGAVVLLFLPMTWLIVLFGLVFAIFAKVRIEIVREISKNDEILDVQTDDETV